MQLEVISREPTTAPKATPLLFVHGAWHAAWCWEEFFLPYFAQHGYSAHALSLRGHGGSAGKVRWASAADYVADVRQAAERLQERFKTHPVVIGHSMGGYVVQKYLEKYPAPAGVLLASIPVQGSLPFFLRQMIKYPWAVLKVMLTLTPYYLVNHIEVTHALFFSPQVSPEQVQQYFSRLQNESFRMVLDSALLKLPRPRRVTTPLLVLGAAEDRVFPVREIEATARAYGTQAEIFPNIAHDMMLEPDWQQVADRMLEWLAARGL